MRRAVRLKWLSANPAEGVERVNVQRATEFNFMTVEQVERWRSDPRVGAVFQYTFRDDPDFPVGLTDAELRSPTSQ